MSNILFGWPNYADVSVLYTPALSGGSWSSSLPLTNLQDRRLHVVARSADALAASTQFDVDLGVARTIGCVAIPKHTMTSSGTVRVRGYSGAGHTTNVYDSGTVTPFPSGLDAETAAGLNIPFVVYPSSISARYWYVELTDTGNPDGYVDVSRLVIAGAFQPTVNISYEAELGLEDATTRVVSDGGAAQFRVRPIRRTLAGVLDEMPESEAFASWWRMQKQLGISGQVFVAYDPADTTYKHDRAFLATFRAPSALVQANHARQRTAFSLVEEL